MIQIRVYGLPAPQGSKRFFRTPSGKGIAVESSKKVKPWRQDVVAAAIQAKPAGFVPLDGPLIFSAIFFLPAPATASKRRLEEGPSRKPDLDKLLRSTLDALTTAAVIADDARIVLFQRVEKRYATRGEPLGAHILVREKP